jgi:AraC family cel operon transcriptional repressor
MREALPRACEPEHLLAGRSALVALCGRSHEHVSRSFRKYLSLSPTEWLTQERLRYACRLLETTQRSITDVAMDCGFESQSYFHQRFKAARGMTPLQFRRKASGVQSAENRARPRRPSQDEREPC